MRTSWENIHTDFLRLERRAARNQWEKPEPAQGGGQGAASVVTGPQHGDVGPGTPLTARLKSEDSNVCPGCGGAGETLGRSLWATCMCSFLCCRPLESSTRAGGYAKGTRYQGGGQDADRRGPSKSTLHTREKGTTCPGLRAPRLGEKEEVSSEKGTTGWGSDVGVGVCQDGGEFGDCSSILCSC